MYVAADRVSWTARAAALAAWLYTASDRLSSSFLCSTISHGKHLRLLALGGSSDVWNTRKGVDNKPCEKSCLSVDHVKGLARDSLGA